MMIPSFSRLAYLVDTTIPTFIHQSRHAMSIEVLDAVQFTRLAFVVAEARYTG